jgi:hypothetical protein
MKKTLIVLTILAGAVVGAQASIILSDDFNSYNLGPIVGQSAWVNVSGTAGTSQVTNGPVDKVLEISGASARSEDIAQPLPGGPYMTNGAVSALYSKFTVRFVNPPTTAAGAYFAHFTGDSISFNYHGRIWASLTNANAGVVNYVTNGGYFYLGIGNSSGAIGVTSGAGQLTNVFTTNVTYTIVTRFVITNGLATIWLNPSAETDPGATANDPNDITNYNNITWYGFRQATGPGLLWVDDFKVGTSFSDVAGVNQAPSVSSISAQTLPKGGNTGPLSFTVSDPETVANLLTVTATSDNLTLVPNGSPNIVLASDGGGTNRTITVTPAASQQGSANITINANDGANNSFTTFKVTVGAPTIGAIPNQITTINTATPPVPFNASDAENDTLTFVKTSSNPTLVTTAGIAVTGSSPNWDVTVTPQSGQSGVTTITLGVADGHNTNYTSFKVTVPPASVGLVYNEDFAYTNFDLTDPNALVLAAGGSGGPWAHVSGVKLNELQVTNGLAFIVGTNNEDVGASLIGSAAYNGTNGYIFYTSFNVNFSYLPSIGGEYFFHLSASQGDNSAFHDKVFANRANAATGKFRLAVANSANSPVQLTRDLMLGATYAVVTRYNSATGDTVLWVNPTSEQNPGAAASDSPGSSTIGGVALRQAGCCTGDLAIGPMKVGTAFSNVWTAPAQPLLQWKVDNSGNLVLDWTNPAAVSVILQGAPNAAGPYTDIDATITAPSSNGSYTISPSGQQYFRLSY